VEFKEIYFLGIGGIGMSAIARYFNSNGVSVAGYDKTSTPLTQQLAAEGMDISYMDVTSTLPDFAKNSSTIVVYTPAIPKDSQLLQFFVANGNPMLKRSVMLGKITETSFSIAVAGTHGKTTTSSMIAYLLSETSGCSAFLGGIATNFNSNLVINTATNTTVVEADEYDRSFLTLSPDIAVITSTDADHLDIYGEHDELKKSFQDFANKIKTNGTLILKNGLPIAHSNTITYGIEDEKADYSGNNIRVENGKYLFDLKTPQGQINAIKIGLPGIHNVENGIAAFIVGKLMNLSNEAIVSALEGFKGVKRRFEKIIDNDSIIYIDDYAHHPKELEMCIKSVKQLYPSSKITGIFQPHLFTRTRDFAVGFSESLSLLDELILLDIYPARELPIEGVSSAMLLPAITSENKMIVPMSEVVNELKKRKLEVVLTLGAGDIDTLVEPIKKYLLS
jgi:UDP-N-acetylmuramate--alanine ligase